MIKRLYRWFYRKSASVGSEADHSSGPWQNAIRQNVLDICGDIGGLRAVEVGCGRGYFLAELAAKNPSAEVWGVDFSGVELAAARRRAEERGLSNMHLEEQEATRLSLGDSSFDIVICINLLICLPSLDAARSCLENACRVCKPGGRIVFDYRNVLNPLIPLKYKLAPLYDPTVKHHNLRAYAPSEIRKILKELNMEILSERFLGFPVKAIAPVVIIEAGKR